MRVLENFKDRGSMEFLKNKWESLSKICFGKSQEEIEAEELEKENEKFIELVNKAKEDWEEAKNFFEEVSHPDMIDIAIYRMEAAKTFYMYLLKEAKEKGIKAKI